MLARKRTHPNGKRKSIKPKLRYHLKNWKAYNQALVKRGSLTVWFDRQALKHWYAEKTPGKVGHPFIYSELVLRLMVVLQEVFHLRLRQTEGFVVSVLNVMKIRRRRVPDYSTLCRRRQTLAIALPQRHTTEPIHVVVDASGLKVYGDGEWKVKVHGAAQRRAWRKLHIGVDEATGDLTAAVLTDEATSDHAIFAQVIDQTRAHHTIKQVSGDGGYDYYAVYRYLQQVVPKARVTMLPRHNAALSSQPSATQRNRNIQYVRTQDRDAWKQQSGYSRRSLAETAFFRLKTIFGSALSARREASQRVQALTRCRILNHMTVLGMPEAYPVAVT